MPYVMTHNYFAKDVYKKLKPKVKRKIDQDSMITFAEGPDVFYYSFLNLQKMSKTWDFGDLVHETQTKKFFHNYIDHMMKYRLEKNKEIVGSLYGYITHFILDAHTHPLIYYKTGCYNSKNPKTEIYNGKHSEMELLIDLYMLEKREKRDPKKIRVDKMVFLKNSYSVQLKNLLNRVYQDTYGIPNMGRQHLGCLKQMRFLYRYCSYDPHGIKLKCYQFLTTILPSKMLFLKYVSYASNLRSKISYINYEHNTWCHPLDLKETSTDSFFDLYNKAVAQAVDLIHEIDKVLAGDMDLRELEKRLQNISYITGKDCRIRKPMRYFEY